ncbi:MAG: F0F1 ATP synthase subunit epsilon, partial [Bacteroidetes bacterium]|nr:F0F1 ATP synthase subunit epsilon [Bacteroidota bacterium]
MNLEIISPDKVIYQDVVDSITIPGTLGGFQVLKNHAPLMSTIEVGIVIV